MAEFKAIRTAECKEHKYKPEIEQRAPIWDTGISYCLDCVWAWNYWLESMLEHHGGHTADCEISRKSYFVGDGQGGWRMAKCDCGWGKYLQG